MEADDGITTSSNYPSYADDEGAIKLECMDLRGLYTRTKARNETRCQRCHFASSNKIFKTSI